MCGRGIRENGGKEIEYERNRGKEVRGEAERDHSALNIVVTTTCNEYLCV
jgi:hypothetical protein